MTIAMGDRDDAEAKQDEFLLQAKWKGWSKSQVLWMALKFARDASIICLNTSMVMTSHAWGLKILECLISRRKMQYKKKTNQSSLNPACIWRAKCSMKKHSIGDGFFMQEQQYQATFLPAATGQDVLATRTHCVLQKAWLGLAHAVWLLLNCYLL